MKDKLIEIWLWAVAVAFTVGAYVVGLLICIKRYIDG